MLDYKALPKIEVNLKVSTCTHTTRITCFES